VIAVIVKQLRSAGAMKRYPNVFDDFLAVRAPCRQQSFVFEHVFKFF